MSSGDDEKEALRKEARNFESQMMQGAVDHLMPKQAQERRVNERAGAAAARPDFLTQNCSGLSLTTTMTAREAVAVSCEINRSYAWVVDHQVGEGVARDAIKKARERMEYLEHGAGTPPDKRIALEFLVDHAHRLRWDLPPEFPGAAGHLLRIGEETAEERRARRYQLCIDAGLRMPTNPSSRLPNGIKAIAEKEGIARPSLAEDLKAHINHLYLQDQSVALATMAGVKVLPQAN
jgi:hypothetical protein